MITNSTQIVTIMETIDYSKFPKSFRVSSAELALFKLPEKFPAREMVQRIRISGTSNVKDHIDLTATPYLENPLELIGQRGRETVGLLGPTQGGKSVFLQCVVADSIDQDPGTVIYTFPDRVSAVKAIEYKIIGMIRRTKELWDKVAEPKSRNLSPMFMRFKNMIIQPGWGGSLAALSSTPAKRVIIDEVRLFPLTIGDESNVIELLRDRLTTWLEEGSGQMFLASTPSVEGDLLHQQLDKPFTQVFLWYSFCPSCGKSQILDFFTNVKFDNKDASDAKCLCKFCKDGEFTSDDQKRSWNLKGKYAPAGFEEILSEDFPDWHDYIDTHNYFWFTSMVSPFRTFTRIAKKFIEVKGKYHDLKNFIQCWLARFFRISESNIGVDTLRERQVDIPQGVVPDWCKVITAGGDTQDNGLYITFRAHGDGRKTHLIDTVFIPVIIESIAVKDFADLIKINVEERVFTSESGEKWSVGRWSFDTAGHRETEMQNVTRHLSKATRVRGKNTNMVSPLQPSSNIADLWFAKTYDYLEITENECSKEYWTLHQGVSDDYITQFLCAKKVKEQNKKTGTSRVVWIKENGGQTDWRMAEIHNFITLDLPFRQSTLRHMLEVPDWEFNPASIILKVQGERTNRDLGIGVKEKGYASYNYTQEYL